MSMIYGVASDDKYVYHYTTSAIATKFILRDRTLRFGPFLGTNDPKESKDWKFGLMSKAKLGEADVGSVSRWLSSTLKANARLACFCTDRKGLSGDHT